MIVREICVSRTVRMNTGNHEGTEHLVSMRAEIDELDDELVEAARLGEAVDLAMVTQLRRSYGARNKRDMTRERIARHHGLYIGGDEK